MTKERDKYRKHRDELADIVSNKVKDVMWQHMNKDGISESSFHIEDENSYQDIGMSEISNKNTSNENNKQHTEGARPKISR